MCVFKNLLGKKNIKKYASAIQLIEKNNIASLRKSTRILIVDDEDDNFYHILKEREYNAYYKSDMTYSVEAEPFQIVILDIRGVAQRRKSSMEGFALACDIKKAYPLKKVCCYSGSVHTEISQQLPENKIDVFFLKDLDMDIICDKIDKLIMDHANYEMQWEVLYKELRHSNVKEEDIGKIRKAYFESFENGNVSELGSIMIDTLKNGTTMLNIISSILTLLKVVMVP